MRLTKPAWPCRLYSAVIVFVNRLCLQIDTDALTWHDHDMQTMSVQPKRRSVGDGLQPSAFLPLPGLLFLASATASLVTAQTSAPPQDRLGRRVHGGSSCPWRNGLRPKLLGVSCALGRRQGAAGGRTVLEEFRAKKRRRSARVRKRQHAERHARFPRRIHLPGYRRADVEIQRLSCGNQ